MKLITLCTAITAVLGIAVWFLINPTNFRKFHTAPTFRGAFVPRPVIFSGISDDRSDLGIYLNGLGMKIVALGDAHVGFASHEVNRSQFAQFAPKTESTKIDPAKFLHPVSGITWREASDFCQWLSEREGLNYRLPTDFEWSIAAGLTEPATASPARRVSEAPILFYWGNQWPPQHPTDNLADQSRKNGGHVGNCFPFDDGFAGTAPGGSFSPNERGIFDLGGNVREWVHDWFDEREEDKTIRGASYLSDADEQKFFSKGFRSFAKPNHSDETVGFRVVLELDDRSRPLFVSDILPQTDIAQSPAPAPIETPAVPETDDVELTQPVISDRDGDKPTELVVADADADADDEAEDQNRTEPPNVANVANVANRYLISYKGNDGVNIRSQSSFDAGNIAAVIMPQRQITFERIGDTRQQDGVEWARIEIKGWIPVKVGKSTFLESIGEKKWKVIWNKPGDQFVALRSEADSESTLIARINYQTEVEELDKRSEGSRNYIFARSEGWAVIKNKVASYLEPAE